MKALVIGYGSIGKRHAEVLSSMNMDVAIVSRRTIQQDNLNMYLTVQEALNSETFDYIVIANETAAHLPTALEIEQLNFKGKILIEKPLFLNEELTTLSAENKYVAYNLRYHPLIEELKMLLKNEVVISVNAYVGQYLPTWRPMIDYSKSYSAFSHLGGGVLRDLSHELDYLLMIFGQWNKLTSISEKISDLHIDSEDYVKILYTTKGNNTYISLELNYLDRIIQRYMIIQTNNKTIKLDFIENSINCNGEIQFLNPIERNYTYEKQHNDILNTAKTCCSFEEGLNVMKMINCIEKSSNLKEWVYND